MSVLRSHKIAFPVAAPVAAEEAPLQSDPLQLFADLPELALAIDRSFTEQEVRRGLAEARPAGNGAGQDSRLRLAPWLIIPPAVWRERVGLWLAYVLELRAYDEWNILYLPIDMKTSLVLDLPIHPAANAQAAYATSMDAELNHSLERLWRGFDAEVDPKWSHQGGAGPAMDPPELIAHADHTRRAVVDMASRMRSEWVTRITGGRGLLA